MSIIGICVDCGDSIIDESDVGISLTDKCLDCQADANLREQAPWLIPTAEWIADEIHQLPSPSDGELPF